MTVRELQKYFRTISHEQLPYHWLECYLLSVLGKDKGFLIAHDDYQLSDEQMHALNDGVAQMQNGKPLAYVLGHQAFFGHQFFVNEHTLIPRPDTEILVETVLGFVRERGLRQGKILDLGTGSGCIAITLAKALPAFEVLAVDFSKNALQITQKNITHLQATNCQCLWSDWFSAVVGRFDVIVSNPPYIADDDEHLANLTAEPLSALVADHQGLSDIKTIIKNSIHHLNPRGLLAIEHGHQQAMAVQALFCQFGFGEVCTVQDYGGNDRVTLGVYLP